MDRRGQRELIDWALYIEVEATVILATRRFS
jgi:hypothetical protein